MDIWAMIQNYVDPIAVFISLLGTEIAARFIPHAEEKGSAMNRSLPFISLALGVATVGLTVVQLYPLAWIIKGLASGAFASYARRVFKVVILGD